MKAEDHPEPAQFAALNDPAHFADVRIEGVGVADDQMQPGPFGGGDHGVAFLERQSERLFDQHMLAVLHRFDRLKRMEAMGRCDVDRLDGRVAAQFVKVRIHVCAKLPRESLARARQRIHAGTELNVRMNRRGADHECAGETEAGDPQTKSAAAQRCLAARAHERQCRKHASRATC